VPTAPLIEEYEPLGRVAVCGLSMQIEPTAGDGEIRPCVRLGRLTDGESPDFLRLDITAARRRGSGQPAAALAVMSRPQARALAMLLLDAVRT